VAIVLGGPMRVSDVGGEKYPFLAEEVALLKRLIQYDRPVLGIGLGAQLLAHAAGAKVMPNTRAGSQPTEAPVEVPELGWHPVTFPFPGGTEPMVMGMIDHAPMFHWHFDTFELPRLPGPAAPAPPGTPPPPTGNSLLSSSKLSKNQAFRFKNRLFGFQYHFEFTTVEIDAIVSGGREHIAKVLGPDGEKTLREQTTRNMKRYSRLGDRLIGNFVQFTKTY
jgi:GMP synthase (glutamine-hydrolysing)